MVLDLADLFTTSVMYSGFTGAFGRCQKRSRGQFILWSWWLILTANCLNIFFILLLYEISKREEKDAKMVCKTGKTFGETRTAMETKKLDWEETEMRNGTQLTPPFKEYQLCDIFFTFSVERLFDRSLITIFAKVGHDHD